MDSKIQTNEDTAFGTLTSINKLQNSDQKFLTCSSPNQNVSKEAKSTFLGFKKFTKTYSLAEGKGQAKIKVWENNDNKRCFLQVSHFRYMNQIELKHSDVKVNGQINFINDNNDLFKSEKTIVEELVVNSNKDTANSKKLWKVVKLKEIPKNTGVNSIISQISGGPLENISLERSKPFSDSLTSIIVEFVKQRDADQFMKLAKTNLFKINGQQFNFDWAKQDKMVGIQSTSVSELKIQDKEAQNGNRKEVSRVLIMKRVTSRRKMIKLSITSETPLQKLNVEEIKDDFLKYGPIQDITPVISKNLCISVIFLNRSSAVRAMEDLNTEKSEIYSRYSRYWTIWYGKDTTDRPIFIL